VGGLLKIVDSGVEKETGDDAADETR